MRLAGDDVALASTGNRPAPRRPRPGVSLCLVRASPGDGAGRGIAGCGRRRREVRPSPHRRDTAPPWEALGSPHPRLPVQLQVRVAAARERLARQSPSTRWLERPLPVGIAPSSAGFELQSLWRSLASITSSSIEMRREIATHLAQDIIYRRTLNILKLAGSLPKYQPQSARFM